MDEEKIWKLFIEAFVFSTFFEGIQIFNSIPGTLFAGMELGSGSSTPSSTESVKIGANDDSTNQT